MWKRIGRFGAKWTYVGGDEVMVVELVERWVCLQLMWVLVGVILLAVGVGLAWAFFNLGQIRSVPVGNNMSLEDELHNINFKSALGIVEIGAIIHEGATEFIVSEYKTCSVFIAIIAAIVWTCVDGLGSCYTTFAFVTGAVTSMACGAFGMHIATLSNFRTTICARGSLGAAFRVAYRAGVVIGFALVAVSLLVLLVLICVYKQLLGLEGSSRSGTYYDFLFESIAGFGLGGSTVALFARVGGGIFTKAADLGSDLVGKIESGLPEDSPRNPATIADNVGDNVGDIAGMGADLFGSFAESTCAALVIGCSSLTSEGGNFELDGVVWVLAVPAVGVLVSAAVSSLITEGEEVAQPKEVERALKKQLVFSTLLLLPVLWAATHFFLPAFRITLAGTAHGKTSTHPFLCLSLGLLGGLVIGYATEIMTSYTYNPVQQLSDACKMGPATNIIYGLALGYFSTIVPVVVLCLVCYFAHDTLGFYGVALAALGMLSNLPICLAIDSYGPVSDNAGGIAEMAELPAVVRQRTDVLDSAGNTTAAIGKGFAIGSATLVGFALYGAFLHTAEMFGLEKDVSFNDPLVFSCLLFGSMIPYAFSAMTIKSVGHAALGMIEEVRRQIRENPGILDGTTPPDYKACVRMSTRAALRDLVRPGLLVTVTPFLLGFCFGPKALVGFLPGAIVSGVQMAISASNTGGAWDNAKKYIEAGLMRHQGEVVGKGSEIHKAAVVGDTVGDPLKDTSGPSLNILIKLMAILSLVFCQYFSK